MKKYLFFAAALVALASCSDDNFVGENSPNLGGENGDGGAIVFASSSKGVTRGDIYGASAADLLGSHFYVTGTKGTEPSVSPTTNLVFDNYLVHYGVNTAGTTESNTANWEYVGVVPGTAPDANYVKLSSLNTQTIKYWDYSTTQYDFLAFSTGSHKAVSSTTPSTGEIGVTAMAYGDALKSSGTAYTFYIPDVAAIKNAYITDITEVAKANYGKEVQLKFKNLGSKVRVALYETVPGYSVKNVQFYTVDGTNSFTDASKDGTAKLISADANGLPTNGSIAVYYPHVGSGNEDKADYNKASATVTSPASGATYNKYLVFDDLTAQLTGKDPNGYETGGSIYLGRSLPNATFAGSEDASFYQTVFPVSSSSPLTLRVDYTLESIDGSGEVINIYGAKAVVPATYTVWLPNYAYTYIFKISDNTNGWTNPDGTNPAGLFPITFDAVVTEATDAQGEQTTVTTVATPSITTYQQGHNPKADGSFGVADEYDNDGNKLYVQVMDNNLTPAKLVGTATSKLPLLNAAQESATPKYHASLLYKVSDATATEAMVMDALEKRTATIGDYNTDVKGRNGITLTYNANINNAVTSIENGVDNNSISVTAGQAAEIAISSLTAGTYAYVYDYSWQSTSGAWTTSTTYTGKHEVKVYQPITTSTSSAIGANGKYYIAISSLTTWDAGITTEPTHYTSSESAAEGYLYFSITTNGGATTTYSFISVDGKIGTALPDGLLKVPADQLTAVADNTALAAADTFYFDTYYSNDGKYAVKVIKVVE